MQRAVPVMTLASAQNILRQQTQLGFYDAKMAERDKVRPIPSATKATLQVAIGTHSEEGIKAAAYDKATGEWKARATGGRRTQFGAHTLHDHHVDQAGLPLGRRKQQSNFFMTLNTNKRKFDEVRDIDAMSHAINKVFKQGVFEILKFGPAHPATYAADGDKADDVIEKVEVKAGIERGPVTGALHAHLYLTITHWSQLQIDVPRLQFLFKEAYNEKAVTKMSDRGRLAVKVELQPQTDYSQIIAHYLSKSVGADPTNVI
jgi:hypothetical protein